MKTTVAMLVSVLALSGPGQSWAVPQDAPPELAAGIRQVEDGDLETAVATLEKAIQQLTRQGARKRDVALAHVYLGMAHLGLDHHERAQGALRDAWMHDNDLKLDDKKFPPRLRQLYEAAKNEAREEKKRAEGAAKGTPAAPPPAPAATSAAPAARASSPVSGVSVGSRVRVSAAATENKWVVGTVTSYDTGSVTLRREDSGSLSVPVSAASFEMSNGRASKRRRALMWGLAGAVLGAGAGYLSGCDYSNSDCFSDDRGKRTGLGAGGGALLGGLVGAMTAGERWEPVGRRVSVQTQPGGLLFALRF